MVPLLCHSGVRSGVIRPSRTNTIEQQKKSKVKSQKKKKTIYSERAA